MQNDKSQMGRLEPGDTADGGGGGGDGGGGDDCEGREEYVNYIILWDSPKQNKKVIARKRNADLAIVCRSSPGPDSRSWAMVFGVEGYMGIG
jgi:hypothetical protein